MFRARMIPCLLLRQRGLVKTVRFDQSRYIGDPINAVHIFNAMHADELIFLDIDATPEKRTPPLNIIRQIGYESFMPFSVGGGIRSIEIIKEIIKAGAEKVIINTWAVENPEFIRQAADTFGSSTIVVCIDAKKKKFGGYQIMKFGGKRATGIIPWDFAAEMAEMGAGEIMINSVDRDGSMAGYDIELTRMVADAVDIPVIASGGAGRISDFVEAVHSGHASAVAAGSYFVYHGPRNAVLINFPTQDELRVLFN